MVCLLWPQYVCRVYGCWRCMEFLCWMFLRGKLTRIETGNFRHFITSYIIIKISVRRVQKRLLTILDISEIKVLNQGLTVRSEVLWGQTDIWYNYVRNWSKILLTLHQGHIHTMLWQILKGDENQEWRSHEWGSQNCRWWRQPQCST